MILTQGLKRNQESEGSLTGIYISGPDLDEAVGGGECLVGHTLCFLQRERGSLVPNKNNIKTAFPFLSTSNSFRTPQVNKICNVYSVAVTRVLVSSGSGLLRHQVHLSGLRDLRHQGGCGGEEEEEGEDERGESMQGSFRLRSLAVQLLAITCEGKTEVTQR